MLEKESMEPQVIRKMEEMEGVRRTQDPRLVLGELVVCVFWRRKISSGSSVGLSRRLFEV